MKRISTLALAVLITGSAWFVSCTSNSNAQESSEATVSNDPSTEGASTPAAGLLSANDVQATTPLNNDWVAAGKSIYELKCQSCHKLNEEKLVGPGWKDVTKTRQPEWIMNMILHPDDMLNTDAEAQKLLEVCLVRMPNQNLTKEEARQVLEFMRHNDGEK
jgi:mono/diheme cytochrome c family protein